MKHFNGQVALIITIYLYLNVHPATVYIILNHKSDHDHSTYVLIYTSILTVQLEGSWPPLLHCRPPMQSGRNTYICTFSYIHTQKLIQTHQQTFMHIYRNLQKLHSSNANSSMFDLLLHFYSHLFGAFIICMLVRWPLSHFVLLLPSRCRK